MQYYNKYFKGHDKMNVFVSWSGALSKNVAEVLKTWIPSIIQSVQIFFSPDDIEKGQNWNKRITDELNQCEFGIICLTSENKDAPWINFEAGAIAKTLDSKVAALLVDISPSDIKGPISLYQATYFKKTDFFKLCESINNSLDDGKIKDEILKRTFEAIWPDIEGEIKKLLDSTDLKVDADEDKGGNNTAELLETILQSLREQTRLITDPEKLLPRSYLGDFISKDSLYLSELNQAVTYINYLLNYMHDIVKDPECKLDNEVSGCFRKILELTVKLLKYETIFQLAKSFKISEKIKSLRDRIEEICKKPEVDFPLNDEVD